MPEQIEFIVAELSEFGVAARSNSENSTTCGRTLRVRNRCTIEFGEFDHTSGRTLRVRNRCTIEFGEFDHTPNSPSSLHDNRIHSGRTLRVRICSTIEFGEFDHTAELSEFGMAAQSNSENSTTFAFGIHWSVKHDLLNQQARQCSGHQANQTKSACQNPYRLPNPNPCRGNLNGAVDPFGGTRHRQSNKLPAISALDV